MLNYFNLLAGIGIFFGLLLVAMNPTGHLRRDGTWVGRPSRPMAYARDICISDGDGITAKALSGVSSSEVAPKVT